MSSLQMLPDNLVRQHNIEARKTDLTNWGHMSEQFAEHIYAPAAEPAANVPPRSANFFNSGAGSHHSPILARNSQTRS